MNIEFFKWSFFILFVIWFCVRMPYKKKALLSKKKKRKDVFLETFLEFLNYISMMFLPLFVVFSSSIDFAAMNLPYVIRCGAIILYALNLILFIWCHKSLGDNWSSGLEIREGHKLIQKGPYEKIRHPMYTHFWLLIISQGLILDNWIVLVYGLIAWGTLYFLRVGKEEEMMIEEFGDEYREYIKRTRRLISKLG